MPFKDGFGPLVVQNTQVEWNSLDALEREIARVGAANVAAFLFEPVVGSGGVHLPPAGYLEGAEALCRSHGILTIADVVIAGFGRRGGWYGVERFGLAPDLIVFAKGVTSGYLPLGGVIAAPRVAAPFWSEPGGSFAHGATYSGHATCCAAALANLSVLERDGLVFRAQSLEASFAERIGALATHRLVGEVRAGIGLMAGVALHAELLARDPALASRFWNLARQAGVLTRGLFDGVAVAPPLTVADHEIDLIVQGLGEALDALAREAGTQYGGFGGVFEPKQSPKSDKGFLELFYLSDKTRSGFDNLTFFEKSRLLVGQDQGDGLHSSLNALDSIFLFDVNGDYAGGAQPVRVIAEGRDASATIDSALLGIAGNGFQNDGDNETTGIHESNGDPTPAGLLGAAIPKGLSRDWRLFFTHQHGDNVTSEVIAA